MRRHYWAAPAINGVGIAILAEGNLIAWRVAVAWVLGAVAIATARWQGLRPEHQRA